MNKERDLGRDVGGRVEVLDNRFPGVVHPSSLRPKDPQGTDG